MGLIPRLSNQCYSQAPPKKPSKSAMEVSDDDEGSDDSNADAIAGPAYGEGADADFMSL